MTLHRWFLVLVLAAGCGDDDRESPPDDDGGTDGDTDGSIEEADGAMPDYSPEFTSDPVTTAREGRRYVYAALATELNGDPLQYRVGEGPEGMTVDEFGLVSWLPGPNAAGSVPVTLVASDDTGRVGQQDYVITVEAGTVAPEIVSYPGLIGVSGTTYSYRPEVVDPDDTELTFTVVAGPSGMRFNDDTLEWNVPSEGGNYAALIRVTDPTGARDEQAFSVGVLSGSDAPTVAITAPEIGSSHSMAFDVLGTATDADLAGYEILACPRRDDEPSECKVMHHGLSPVTSGVLGTFDPRTIQNGAYFLTVIAHDAGGRSTRASVPIQVIGYGKEGAVNLSFVDLDVDGVVQLTRVFRSTAPPGGDFGDQWTTGWAKDYGQLQLQADLDSGWVVTCSIGGCTVEDDTGDHDGNLVVGGRLPYKINFKFQDTGSGVSSIHTAIPYAEDPTGRLQVDLLIPNTETVPTEVWVWRDTGEVTWTDDPFSQPFRPWVRILTEDLTLITYDTASERIIDIRTPYGVEAEMENGRPTTISRFGRDFIRVEYDGDYIRRATDLTSGDTVEYERSEDGELIAVHKSEGDETYRYDAQGRLEEWNAPGLNAPIHYRYDSLNRVIEVSDDRGVSFNEYRDDENTVIRTDALNRVSRVTRDDLGRIIELEDPLGGVTRMEFEGDRPQPTRSIDRAGRETQFTYDDNGRLLTTTDTMGRTREYGYEGGGLSRYQDPSGNEFAIDMDSDARPASYSINGEVLERYEYPEDRTITVRDPEGNLRREIKTDERGRPLELTDQHGRTQTYEYMPDGMVRFENGDGDEQTWRQDLRGRLTEVPVGDDMVRYEYSANGSLPARVVTPTGGLEVTYGPGGKITRMVVDGQETLSTRLDSMRRVASSRSGDGTGQSYRYDELDRVSAIVTPDGTQTFTYDETGHIARIDDGAGGTSDLARDPLGRVTEVRNDTTSLHVDYDDNGNVQELHGVGEQAIDVALEHDHFGQMTRREVNGVAQEFRYSDAARPTESVVTGVTLADGQRFDYERDESNQITSVRDGTGATASYTYGENGMETRTDAMGNTVRYEITDGGMSAIVWAGGGREEWLRDDSGALAAHVATDGTTLRYASTDTQTLVVGPTETYETAYEGSTTTERVRHGDNEVEGRTLSFDETTPTTQIRLDEVRAAVAHDANGEVEEISIVDGAGAVHSTRYDYDEGGRLHRIADPMGGVTTYSYDDRNRLSEVRVDTAVGATTMTRYEYDGGLPRASRIIVASSRGTESVTEIEYDAVGRVSERSVNGAGVTHSEAYTYDEASRIATARIDGVTTTYSYDAVGNLTREAGPAGTTTYSYDADYRLTESRDARGVTGYEYDGYGALTRVRHAGGGQTDYRYDDQQHLVGISGPQGDYEFDVSASGKLLGWRGPEGERRCLPSLEGSFLDSRSCLATWTPGDPDSLRVFVPSAETTASAHTPSDPSGSRYAWQTDDQGSVGGLVDVDGMPVAAIAYGVRGAVAAQSGESFDDFPTFQNTRAFGTHHYFGARFFDVATARSLTRDPVAVAVGDTQLSPYRFLRNSAWNVTDPTGAQDFASLSISMSEGSAIDAINWGAVGAVMAKIGLVVGGGLAGGWGLAKLITWYNAAIATAAVGTTLAAAVVLTDAEIAGELGEVLGEAIRAAASEFAWHANIAARLCRALDPVVRGYNALKRSGISIQYAYLRSACGKPLMNTHHANGTRPGALTCVEIAQMGAAAILQALSSQAGVDIMLEYTRGTRKWQQGIELKQTDSLGGTEEYQTAVNCRLMSRNPDTHGTPTGVLANAYSGSLGSNQQFNLNGANQATLVTACLQCWSLPQNMPRLGDSLANPADLRCRETYPRIGPRAGQGAIYVSWNALRNAAGGVWNNLPH